LEVDIKDDDTADVNLYTLSPNSYSKVSLQPSDWADSYKVKFLNFFCPEGGMVAYGVKLDTQPTANVVIKTNITLNQPDENSTILFPPSLQADPAELTFTSDNWDTRQRVKLNCAQNNVDHDNNRFQILHDIETTDSRYSSLTDNTDKILAMVDAADDDTAGVALKSTAALSLQEAGADFKYAEIAHFDSQPVADVTVIVNISSVEHRSKIATDPADGTITIAKEDWNTHTGKIGFKALSGALPNDPGISFRMVSDDPKYQYPALPEVTVAANIVILAANSTGHMEFNAQSTGYKQYPGDLSVNENQTVKYELRLAQSVIRTKDVTVDISVAPTNGFSCSVSPSVSRPLFAFAHTYSSNTPANLYLFSPFSTNTVVRV
jgi:hypothetical protein